MSPLEIWCNEAQERYVLVIGAEHIERFVALCARERCPCAVVGDTTDDGWLKVSDRLLEAAPVDVPLDVILGKPPQDDARRASPASIAAMTSMLQRSTSRSRCIGSCDSRRLPTRPFS